MILNVAGRTEVSIIANWKWPRMKRSIYLEYSLGVVGSNDICAGRSDLVAAWKDYKDILNQRTDFAVADKMKSKKALNAFKDQLLKLSGWAVEHPSSHPQVLQDGAG